MLGASHNVHVLFCWFQIVLHDLVTQAAELAFGFFVLLLLLDSHCRYASFAIICCT